MILANHGIISSSGALSFDADALAFITAASITDNTQKTAINTLVTDLKTYNIWTKMKAIYPFVGGSATAHKWNLKDPRDLDAAFRLVFSGGGTHSSNGYQLNGSNAFADTFFTPSSHFISAQRAGIGVYSRTERGSLSADVMGVNSGSGWIFLKLNDSNFTYALINTNWANISGPTLSYTTTKGFFQASRDNSTNTQLINRNGTTTSGASNTTGLSTSSITIGRSSALYYDNVQLAYAFISDDMSSTDLINHRNAVEAYQLTLSRNA